MSEIVPEDATVMVQPRTADNTVEAQLVELAA